MADLPDNIQAFLRRFIVSVEQLEVLLLLRASGREWTPAEVTRELASSLESASGRLELLVKSRLVVKTAGEPGPVYRYDPVDASVRGLVDEIADVYPRRRVAIISFIFSRPDENLRDFSNAFRLRRKRR